MGFRMALRHFYRLMRDAFMTESRRMSILATNMVIDRILFGF
jgi:hypothetical protein